MKLEGRAQKIIKEMREEGKVTDISQQDTYRIDHALAINFEKIKAESEQKERASRAYISDVESGRINFYKKESVYQKISKYISSLKNLFN